MRELQLQRKAPRTIRSYVASVAQLAEHYRRSPDQLSLEQVRDWIHYLIVVRMLSDSTVNVRIPGLRFFFQHVLRPSDFDLNIRMRGPGRLPEVLSREEVHRVLDSCTSIRQRTLLMTVYGAGLRVGELVSLRTDDLHADRGLIRIRHGKGDRERYSLLSASLVQQLRNFWRADRQGTSERLTATGNPTAARKASVWLFPGDGIIPTIRGRRRITAHATRRRRHGGHRDRTEGRTGGRDSQLPCCAFGSAVVIESAESAGSHSGVSHGGARRSAISM